MILMIYSSSLIILKTIWSKSCKQTFTYIKNKTARRSLRSDIEIGNLIYDNREVILENLNKQRELTTSEDGIWWGAHNHFK